MKSRVTYAAASERRGNTFKLQQSFYLSEFTIGKSPLVTWLGLRVRHAGPFVGVFQKSIPDRFVIFRRLFPSKWLQNRPQIPKPSPGIPPHRAFCGKHRLPVGILSHRKCLWSRFAKANSRTNQSTCSLYQ